MRRNVLFASLLGVNLNKSIGTLGSYRSQATDVNFQLVEQIQEMNKMVQQQVSHTLVCDNQVGGFLFKMIWSHLRFKIYFKMKALAVL